MAASRSGAVGAAACGHQFEARLLGLRPCNRAPTISLAAWAKGDYAGVKLSQSPMPRGFIVSAAKCAADSRQHPGEEGCRLTTDRPGLKA